MNLPRLFERVYCQPLAVTRERFLSIHSVLFPRMVSGGDFSLEMMAHAGEAGENDRPNTNPYSGKRVQKARPSFREDGTLDNRFFTLAKPGVAVVPIYGVLAKNISAFEESCGGGTDIGPIAAALSQAVADKAVGTIVLDIDSPGGEVTGIPELGSRIRAAAGKKPVYAFTDSSAYSAAYWLASQAGEIYATSSAGLGSIGVRCAWLDETVALQMKGLKLEIFAAGKHKAAGLPFRGLTDEERGMFQARVDAIYSEFAAAITAARPAVTSATMQGQTFSSAEAMARGLVDGIVADWEAFLDLI